MEGEGPWRRRITRFAKWDSRFEVAFIVVMLLGAGVLTQLTSC